MSDARNEAVELLTHYFDQAGVVVNNDNHAEIRKCVDKIIDAAVEEVFCSRAMRQLLSEHV